jgi:hypothetical protein
MECRECRGKGIIEAFVGCSKPASMCCGGCVQDFDCHVCDGSGEVMEGDEIIDRIITVYEKLEAHPVRHKKWIDCLFNEANDLAEDLAQFKL